MLLMMAPFEQIKGTELLSESLLLAYLRGLGMCIRSSKVCSGYSASCSYNRPTPAVFLFINTYLLLMSLLSFFHNCLISVGEADSVA